MQAKPFFDLETNQEIKFPFDQINRQTKGHTKGWKSNHLT